MMVEPTDGNNESDFRQIADNIHQFIWLSDVDFTTHYYVNPAYEQIWGRTRASLYEDAESLLEGVHPEDQQRVKSALRRLGEVEYNIEFRVVRPDGEIRWVRSRGVPVRDASGEVHRIAGITEDVTDRKRSEIELERIIKSRTALIRGFTHDIKNPLGAADGFLSLLADGIYGDLSHKQVESVAKARKSIGSALDLISHLLELARAESGLLEIKAVPVDIGDIVVTIAEAFRPQAHAKGLSLSMELPAHLPEIRSDPARVLQVLGNLISNAVKYTPTGGQITVSINLNDGAAPNASELIEIAVIDTGPGIAPENLTRVFQEFTRFDPSAAHGAGIGLAISQRIAHALGGAIRVKSKVGVGSTFALLLPFDSDRPHTERHEQ